MGAGRPDFKITEILKNPKFYFGYIKAWPKNSFTCFIVDNITQPLMLPVCKKIGHDWIYVEGEFPPTQQVCVRCHSVSNKIKADYDHAMNVFGNAFIEQKKDPKSGKTTSRVLSYEEAKDIKINRH